MLKGLTRKETENQLSYTYSHDIKEPLLFKTFLLLLIYISYNWYLRHLEIKLSTLIILTLISLTFYIPVIKKQSISVIPSVGIQLYSQSDLFKKHKFIPSNKIIDIIINEGFKGLQVVFYLGILIEGNKKIELILPNAGLKLDDLIVLRKELRSKLGIHQQSQVLINNNNE